MKKIVFFADAIGQALNCVAIGQQLRDQNVELIFIADKSFQGTFARYGFQEYLINSHKLSEDAAAAQLWLDYINKSKKNFRLSTYEQIDKYIIPFFDAVIDTAIHAEPHLKKALADIQPDLICFDDIVLYPAVKQYGCPWFRIISCNELEIPDPALPPPLSGYSIHDSSNWQKFTIKMQQCMQPVQEEFNRFLYEHGEAPYPIGQLLEPSPYKNFFIFPKVVSYQRAKPLNAEKFIYLNGCVREEDAYLLPKFKKCQDKPLIYLSYGSMGACDVDLIKEQINAFAKTPYRLIVNVGDYLDQYANVPDNVYISNFFPQPSLIKQVDLVIHHGGNNTFNEVLFFGKPSIVLPFAWDGFDNATRVEDLQLGVALHRYQSDPANLPNYVKRLLEDSELKKRLIPISQQMQAAPGTNVAAHEILKFLNKELPDKSNYEKILS